jgi:hypothetical protein
MMPYEIYFYSSGGIEEGWTDTQLPVNRANALIGFPLGGLVAVALTVVAAQQLLTLQVTPQDLSTAPGAARARPDRLLQSWNRSVPALRPLCRWYWWRPGC